MLKSQLLIASLALFLLGALTYAEPPAPKTPGPAAPATVEKNGLTITGAPVKPAFGRKEDPEFVITFTNTGKEAFFLYDARFWVYEINTRSWYCYLQTANGDKFAPTMAGQGMPRIYRPRTPTLLEPGKSYTQVASFFRKGLFINLKDAPDLFDNLKPPAGDQAVVRLEPRDPAAARAPRLQELPAGPASFHFTFKFYKIAPEAVRPRVPPAEKDLVNVPFYEGIVELPGIPFAIDEADYAVAPALMEHATLVVRGRLGGQEQRAGDDSMTVSLTVAEILLKDPDGAVKPGTEMKFRLPKDRIWVLGGAIFYLQKDKDGRWEHVPMPAAGVQSTPPK